MADDWKDLLGQLRAKMGRKGAQSKSNDRVSQPTKPKQTLRINLGIDFGTSYTKVCFYDASEQVSGILELGSEGIISSDIHVGPDGRIFMAGELPKDRTTTPRRYLKMQLADLDIENDDLLECKALCAWFLANVLKASQKNLQRQEKDRFVGREALWSANIGVPVEWYDTEVLSRFEEVLRVAWQWNRMDLIPTHADGAKSAYVEALSAAEGHATDFHAIPEIAAAVQSFVISREATPGLYLYFDIGGGTIDGVTFKFLNKDGEKQIDFLSGKVADLGMVFQNDTPDFWRKVQLLVGSVVVGGKEKDRSDWRQRRHGNRPSILRTSQMPDKHILPLVVFLGGYGSRDKNYKRKIMATYADFNHKSCGIPPYELREVKKPSDLIDRGEHEFRRFAIAYGLSIPFGQGPEIRLPSQIPNDPGPRRRRLANVPDYMDSKDWC